MKQFCMNCNPIYLQHWFMLKDEYYHQLQRFRTSYFKLTITKMAYVVLKTYLVSILNLLFVANGLQYYFDENLDTFCIIFFLLNLILTNVFCFGALFILYFVNQKFIESNTWKDSFLHFLPYFSFGVLVLLYFNTTENLGQVHISKGTILFLSNLIGIIYTGLYFFLKEISLKKGGEDAKI